MRLKDGLALLPYRIILFPGVALALLGYCVILCSIYVVAVQLLFWLEHGVWLSLPCIYWLTDPWPEIWQQYDARIVDAARYAFPNPLFLLAESREYLRIDGAVSGWLTHPSQWLGLHRLVHGVLSFVPVAVLIFLIGWGLIAVARRLTKRPGKALRRKQKELAEKRSIAESRYDEESYEYIEYRDDESSK